MSRRRAERGYALVTAAVAVLLLGLIGTAVVYTSASGTVSGRLDAERTRAGVLAASGLEWALLDAHLNASTGGTGATTAPVALGGGTFEVVREGGPGSSPLRPFEWTSTGKVGAAADPTGEAKRVARVRSTLFFIPESRFADFDSTVAFEVVNRTGLPLTIDGLTAVYGGTAVYRTIEVRVFPEPGLDGRTTTVALGTPLGSGQAATFAPGIDIGAGRQALVQLRGFGAGGPGSAADMDGNELRVTFVDRTLGALPATVVPRATP